MIHYTRKLTHVLMVCGALMCLTVGRASADSAAPPFDYMQRTSDGKYVLVMLPKKSYGRKDAKLRKTYRVSGLYRAGQPTKPLWTIDWYAFGVCVSTDGRHLVRMGPWPSSAEELAVAFYKDGKLLRQYRINQLVADPLSLPHSVSHFRWAKAITFDDRKKQLRLSTLMDERYLFDIKTGLLKEGKLAKPLVQRTRAEALLQKGDMVGLMRLGKQALPELTQALQKGKGAKQEIAFYVICGIGTDALEAIATLATDQNPAVRAMAARALREISAPQSRPILVKLARDNNVNVRILAIGALFQIHAEEEAIPAAMQILKSGTLENKQNLLYHTRGFRPTVLIPEVIALLPRDREYFERGNYQGLERSKDWLEAATYQDFDYLEEDEDSLSKIAAAWDKWWKDNKNHTPDEWYVQAVERAFAQLRKSDPQWAFNQLSNLTGKSFGDSGGVFNRKAITTWEQWWKANKGKRPGEISLSNADERDVKALVTSYKQANEYSKSYVEEYLRRITNVDSFGAVFLGGAREKSVIEQWEKFADASAKGASGPVAP